jgi:antitoxin ParD1/3/4
MTLEIAPDLETRIQGKVIAGLYADADAVLVEALRLLDERDRRLEWLRIAIAKSDEQIARGEGIPYTPELLEEIDREVDERFCRGEMPNSDVCP